MEKILLQEKRKKSFGLFQIVERKINDWNLRKLWQNLFRSKFLADAEILKILEIFKIPEIPEILKILKILKILNAKNQKIPNV